MRGAINGVFMARRPLAQTPRAGWVSDSPVESDRGSRDVSLERGLRQTYDEEDFQYLLAVEQERSERSGRPYLLLRVDLQDQPGVSAPIDPMVAPTLFAGLWLCLRETDVVGWYLRDRVAGAVLTELGDGPLIHVCRIVGQTVRGVLRESLASEIARRLRVRVCQYPGPGRIDVETR